MSVQSRGASVVQVHDDLIFRATFEQACVGMALVNAEGHCLRANPALCGMLGLSLEEFRPTSLRAAVHPDDAAALTALLAGLTRERPPGGDLPSMDLRFVPRLGATIQTRVVLAPLPRKQRPGQPLALFQAQDLTEASSRARGAFLARMSHELRTPLTAILGFAEILLEHPEARRLSDPRREDLRSIIENGTRLRALVDVLLGAARANLDRPAIPEANSSTPRQAPPAAVAPAAPAGPDLKGCRLLVAEDNDDNLRVLTYRLEAAGATVRVARNGEEAVAQGRQAMDSRERLDAVLMDMNMPLLDGYEATRQLRAVGFRAPIIAVTAYASPEDRAECLHFGCDEHVSKPIHWPILLALLAEYRSRGVASM